MTVLVSAVVKPTVEGRAAVREAIATALPLVRQEPGCISYDAAENESEFFFIEQWESPEALKAHSTSPAFTAMVEALGPLLQEPLQVRTGSAIS